MARIREQNPILTPQEHIMRRKKIDLPFSRRCNICDGQMKKYTPVFAHLNCYLAKKKKNYN